MAERIHSIQETIEGVQIIMEILQEDYNRDAEHMTTQEIADWHYAMEHNRSAIHWLKLLHGQLAGGVIRFF